MSSRCNSSSWLNQAQDARATFKLHRYSSGIRFAAYSDLSIIRYARNKGVNAHEKNVERGLAKLVLTLVDLLRQLMERQAVRRMEGGTLTDDEVERLGRTFMLLEKRMGELKQSFGLENEDLNIDLGPLGKLL